MNVVIFYENIEREMQNALLLKCELKKEVMMYIYLVI